MWAMFNRNRKRKSEKQGFTLAEILIVVAIISTTVAISVPIFSNVVNKANKDYEDAKTETDDLISEAIGIRSITPVASEEIPTPPPKSDMVVGQAGQGGGIVDDSGSVVVPTIGTPDDFSEAIPTSPVSPPAVSPKISPTATATPTVIPTATPTSTSTPTPTPTPAVVQVGKVEVTQEQYEKDFPDVPEGATAIYLTEGKQGAYAYDYSNYLSTDTSLEKGVIYTTKSESGETSFYLYIGNPGQDNSNDPYHKNGKDFPNYWYQIVTEYSNDASDSSKNTIHYSSSKFLKSEEPLYNVKGGDMRIDPNGARYIFASYGSNPQNLWVGDNRWVKIADSCIP